VDPKTEKVMMIYKFQTLVNPSTKKFHLDYFRIYFYDEKTSLFSEDYIYVAEDRYLCFCSPWRLLVSEADYDIYIYDRRTFKKL